MFVGSLGDRTMSNTEMLELDKRDRILFLVQELSLGPFPEWHIEAIIDELLDFLNNGYYVQFIRTVLKNYGSFRNVRHGRNRRFRFSKRFS